MSSTPPREAPPREGLLQRIRRRVGQFRPKKTVHLVLARPLKAEPVASSAVRMVRITSPEDARFGAFIEICREQDVDEEWCRDQLERGSIGALALAEDDEPVGVGLVARGRFWVDEIGQTFVTGSDGCYLYAIYVRPPFRGRGIQLLIDHERFAWAIECGARWAYVVVHAANQSSRKAHARSGFIKVASVIRTRWRRWNWTRTHRRSASPAGTWTFAPPDAG